MEEKGRFWWLVLGCVFCIVLDNMPDLIALSCLTHGRAPIKQPLCVACHRELAPSGHGSLTPKLPCAWPKPSLIDLLDRPLLTIIPPSPSLPNLPTLPLPPEMRLFLQSSSRYRSTAHKPSRPFLRKKGITLQVIPDDDDDAAAVSHHSQQQRASILEDSSRQYHSSIETNSNTNSNMHIPTIESSATITTTAAAAAAAMPANLNFKTSTTLLALSLTLSAVLSLLTFLALLSALAPFLNRLRLRLRRRLRRSSYRRTGARVHSGWREAASVEEAGVWDGAWGGERAGGNKGEVERKEEKEEEDDDDDDGGDEKRRGVGKQSLLGRLRRGLAVGTVAAAAAGAGFRGRGGGGGGDGDVEVGLGVASGAEEGLVAGMGERGGPRRRGWVRELGGHGV